MASNVEIKCIKKTNRLDPHERIQGVGGVNPSGTTWYLPLDNAIAGIEAGQWTFYTSVAGTSVRVVIAEHNGHKYLKTEADGIHPNNLLELRSCP